MYKGMPLNIEYRAFIDFNTKQIIDIIDYWDESLEEDIKRRDFTINSVCMTSKEVIIDLVGGVNDIKIAGNKKEETKDPKATIQLSASKA